MTAKINFSKIQKCDQIWDDMPVCDSGRLCQQCDRVIHDFRGVSDWDIAVKHAHSSDKVCGIYNEDTLNGTSQKRTLAFKKARKAIWATTMAGLTSITTLSALSQSTDPVHILEKDLNVRDSIPDENRESSQDALVAEKQRIVKGAIFDSDNREGMIGGCILISGTKKGAVADIDGHYTLDISSELANQDSVKLLGSYLGYESVEKIIYAHDFEKDKSTLVQHFELLESTGLVFGVYARPPWYKRVWYKITKVFR